MAQGMFENLRRMMSGAPQEGVMNQLNQVAPGSAPSGAPSGIPGNATFDKMNMTVDKDGKQSIKIDMSPDTEAPPPQYQQPPGNEAEALARGLMEKHDQTQKYGFIGALLKKAFAGE